MSILPMSLIISCDRYIWFILYIENKDRTVACGYILTICMFNLLTVHEFCPFQPSKKV
jgi:hypothetical protein